MRATSAARASSTPTLATPMVSINAPRGRPPPLIRPQIAAASAAKPSAFRTLAPRLRSLRMTCGSYKSARYSAAGTQPAAAISAASSRIPCAWRPLIQMASATSAASMKTSRAARPLYQWPENWGMKATSRWSSGPSRPAAAMAPATARRRSAPGPTPERPPATAPRPPPARAASCLRAPR